MKALVSIRMCGTGCVDDVMQDALLSAWMHRAEVQDEARIRAWLFQIARNKCTDYFRGHGREIATDPGLVCPESGHHGRMPADALAETMRGAVDELPEKERDAIRLHYLMGYSVREISIQERVPEGTVKRRMHDGRKRLGALLSGEGFARKGSDTMKLPDVLPLFLPKVSVTLSGEPAFDVVCHEAFWMYESRNVYDTVWFGLYDAPDWRLSNLTRNRTARPARVHGIDCAEVEVTDWDREGEAWKQSGRKVYVAEVEGMVKTLAAAWEDDGVPCYASYLDPCFDDNWNGDVPMRLMDEGRFVPAGDNEYRTDGTKTSIGAGRYAVTIGNRRFDCLRVLDVSGGMVVEGFLLRNGRTLLGRRYNDRLWKVGEGKPYAIAWDERFPHHARLTIDGVTFTHWYDTVSDAAFH